VGARFSRTRPDRPLGPPSLVYNGYRVSFPVVKRPELGFDHPTPSSAEVKERVELYLCSPYEPSCSLPGRNLRLATLFTSQGFPLFPEGQAAIDRGVFRAAKSVLSHPHVMMVMINVVPVTTPLVVFLFRQSSYRLLRREILTSVVRPLKAVVCFALLRSGSEDYSFTVLFDCQLLRSYCYGAPKQYKCLVARRIDATK
jgi:hypothetical protein